MRGARRLLLLAPLLAVAGLLLVPAPAGALFGCGIDPVCMVGKGAGAVAGAVGSIVGGIASSAAGGAITALAGSVLGALGHAIQWASTLWVGVGTPPVADQSLQPTGTVAFLQQNLLVFTTGMAVMCTLLGAARIVYQEHKASQLRELGRYLATYVLVSAAAAGAASVLIGGSDQIASWLIARASQGPGFAGHLANLLGLASASASHAAGAPAGFTVGLAGTVATAFIAIVLGILAFLGTVIQIMLMLVRGGMLVLLVGTLPLVAAFSNTEMGWQWFRKASAWLVAFALYKPAAAVVYAVAFQLGSQQGALALLDGVMMLSLAVLALPALLRFVVPATGALAGAGSTGTLLADAAGGAIAMRAPTGAANVAPMSASTPNVGSRNGGGPSGATPGTGGPAEPPGTTGSGGGSGPTGHDAGNGGAGPAAASTSGSPAPAGPTSAPPSGGASGGAPAGANVVQAYGTAKQAAERAVERTDAGDGSAPSGATGTPNEQRTWRGGE